MDETLIRELVARIMADPRFQKLLPPAGPTVAGMKTEVLVIVENEEGLQALPDIQRRWNSCCSLQLCVAGPVNVPTASLPQISCEQAMVGRRWARLLVPVCSGRQLTQIAMGLRLDKLCDMVAWAVLQGIPVEIGRFDFGFTAQTPPAYRRVLEAYIQQVAAYGIVAGDVVPAAVLPVSSPPAPILPTPMPWSFGEPVIPVEPETRADMTYDKRLMTEKEAILLPENAVLRLPRATVLTPSAMDVLKKQKVQVYREGVRFL